MIFPLYGQYALSNTNSVKFFFFAFSANFRPIFIASFTFIVLPDLILGNWYLECKRYGQGNEPIEKWWSQVLDSAKDKGVPALIYKFNNRPITVRVPLHTINDNLTKDNHLTCDLAWKDFIFILKIYEFFKP